jgi:hypothetical protein
VPDREHDVSGLTVSQLERARRDLEVSLALTWQGSPVRASIAAEMSAIDAELAGRDMIRVCSCGFATDDDEWLGGHLDEYPGHHERDAFRPVPDGQ